MSIVPDGRHVFNPQQILSFGEVAKRLQKIHESSPTWDLTEEEINALLTSDKVVNGVLKDLHP